MIWCDKMKCHPTKMLMAVQGNAMSEKSSKIVNRFVCDTCIDHKVYDTSEMLHIVRSNSLLQCILLELNTKEMRERTKNETKMKKNIT